MNSIVYHVAGLLRPYQIKGKGRLFHPLTPRQGRYRVPVWGSLSMNLDLCNAQQRQIFMGCLGREITQSIQSLLPRGGTFLDVGANIGFFTLLASRLVGDSGTVLAVEPNPPVFDVLAEHLKMNGIANVDARQIALGDRTGTLTLFVPPPEEHRDYNATIMPRSNWIPASVPCLKLDDVLADRGVARVDVMKMDVEGAEPRVLRGGEASLRRGVVKYLMTEMNGPRLVEGGSSPAALLEILELVGFVPAAIRAGKVARLSPKDLDLNPEHEYDRLFAHKSVL